MAKKKRVHLGAKNFFTMTVLSVAALVTLFMANSFLQQQTSTESEATGGSYGSLSACNFKYGRSGGVQLYNKLNQSGGYRVICIKLRSKISDPIVIDLEVDKHLGSIQSGQKYYDIWNFNNKADSLKVRANPWCIVNVELYNGGLGNNLLWKTQIGNNSTGDRYIKKFNLPENKRNKATSIRMWSQCLQTRIPK